MTRASLSPLENLWDESHAASLDEPARYKPQAVTYAARGHDWDHLDPELTKFETMPPR